MLQEATSLSGLDASTPSLRRDRVSLDSVECPLLGRVTPSCEPLTGLGNKKIKKKVLLKSSKPMNWDKFYTGLFINSLNI